MKGERLGEFEELTLLTVMALGQGAYGVTVQEYLEEASGREVSLGAVYAVLDRLERKGLVRSTFGEVTRERGGKRKRLFEATTTGRGAARDARALRESIWKAIVPTRSRS